MFRSLLAGENNLNVVSGRVWQVVVHSRYINQERSVPRKVVVQDRWLRTTEVAQDRFYFNFIYKMSHDIPSH